MSLRQKKSIGVRSNSRERKCKKKYILYLREKKLKNSILKEYIIIKMI